MSPKSSDGFCGALRLEAATPCEQLPARLRETLELLLGVSFDGVRVHVDEAPARIGARAFACGEDIVFAPGEYDPGTAAGRWLLGHELAHVLQQREGRVPRTEARGSGPWPVVSDPALEAEADIFGALTLGLFEPMLEPGDRVVEATAPPLAVLRPGQVIQCKLQHTVEDKVFKFDKVEDVLNYTNQNLKRIHQLASRSASKDRMSALIKDTNTHELRDLVRELVEGRTKRLNELIKLQRTARRRRGLQAAINTSALRDETVTAMRREELRQLTGGLYIAELYGFRTAANLNEYQRGLKVEFPKEMPYMRESYNEAAKIALTSLQMNIDPDESGYRSRVVNSQFYATKLQILRGRYFLQGKTKFKRLTDCIYSLKVANEVDSAFDKEKALKYLGSTPSVYQAIKGYHKPGQAPTRDVSPTNDELLAQLRASEAYATVKETASSNTHPQRLLYHAAEQLVDGLVKLAQTQAKKFAASTVIETALHGVESVLNALAISSAAFADANRLYELLTDELFLILAELRPYDAKAFISTVSTVYRGRVPALANANNRFEIRAVCLESSGMGAITTALAAAVSDYDAGCRIEQIRRTRDYYELNDDTFVKICTLPDGSSRLNPTNSRQAEVLFATLNPSMPEKPGGKDIVDAVFEATKAKLDEGLNVTVVLDVSVEVDVGNSGQLAQLVEKFEDYLEFGNLGLIIAKSYQKYSALGSGKMSAGLIMSINNGDSHTASDKLIEQAMKDSNFIALDESQLLTYFVAAGHTSEVPLLAGAAANATFVNTTVWPTKRELQSTELKNCGHHAKGLPFIVRTLSSEICGDSVNPLFQRCGLEHRSSFGYMTTTYSPIGVDVRVVVGQETTRSLVEKLYGLGRMFEMAKAETTRSEAKDWLYGEIEKFKPQSTAYEAQMLASLLHLVAALAQLDHDELKKLENTINGTNERKEKEKKQAKFHHKRITAELAKERPKLLKLLEDKLLSKAQDFAKLSRDMKEALILDWLGLLSFAKLDAQTEATINERLRWVHSSERAKFFIEDLPDADFAKLKLAVRDRLTRRLFAGVDAQILVFVGLKLVEDGAVEKVLRVAVLLEEWLTVYVLPDTSQSRKLLGKLGIENPDSGLFDRVVTTKSVFVAQLRAAMDNPDGDLDKLKKTIDGLSKLAARKHESCYYVTLEDLKARAKADEIDKLKTLTMVPFTSREELEDALVKRTTKIIANKLSLRAARRSESLRDHQGLGAIAVGVHRTSTKRLREAQEKLATYAKVRKRPLHFLSSSEDEHCDKLKADIKEYTRRVNNAEYCLGQLDEA